MPFVTPGVILVATVNSIGAAFQLIYAIIFIIYADKSKKVTVVPNFFLNSSFPQKLLLFFFCLFELDHLHVLLIFLQLRMSALLIAVFAFFGMVVFVSLRFLETHLRQMVVGYLSVFSLISMFASPLFIIVSP